MGDLNVSIATVPLAKAACVLDHWTEFLDRMGNGIIQGAGQFPFLYCEFISFLSYIGVHDYGYLSTLIILSFFS